MLVKNYDYMKSNYENIDVVAKLYDIISDCDTNFINKKKNIYIYIYLLIY